MDDTAPSAESERAAQEAIDWLLALQEADDPTGFQRARFESWLAASASNANAWASVSGLYAALGETPPRYAHPWRSPPLPAARKAQPRSQTGRWRWTITRAAAGLLIVLCAGLLLGVRDHLIADASTGTGEIREIALADGSKVHLGPSSAIDVDLASHARRIELLSGAAYFEVAPDASRPFIVESDGVVVTALGTAFEINRTETGARVMLDHGRVRIVQDGRSYDLEAGEWRSLSIDGTTQAGAIASDQIAAWRDGKLVAKDRSVAEIVDELGRSYRGIIIVRDHALGEKRLTGAYNLADPVDALRAIARTHRARVTQVTPWILILEPPPSS